MMKFALTNQDRIEAAAIAIEAYRLAKGLTQTTQSSHETLVDLFADLRHFAAAESLDFEAAVQMSEFHFEEESS